MRPQSPLPINGPGAERSDGAEDGDLAVSAPEAPEAWTTIDVSNRLSFAERFEVLARLYPKVAPVHGSIDKTHCSKHPKIFFAPDEFVHEIGRKFYDLTPEEQHNVLRLPWMETTLAMQQESESGYASTPSYDDIIERIAMVAPVRMPLLTDEYLLIRPGGKRVLFYPLICLQKVKLAWGEPYGPSSKGRERLCNLPWGGALVRAWEAALRANRARRVRSIPRAARAKLLCMFYRTEKPSLKDKLPVRLEDGEVILCTPAKWLEGLTSDWLEDATPVLSSKEKAALEKFCLLYTSDAADE